GSGPELVEPTAYVALPATPATALTSGFLTDRRFSCHRRSAGSQRLRTSRIFPQPVLTFVPPSLVGQRQAEEGQAQPNNGRHDEEEDNDHQGGVERPELQEVQASLRIPIRKILV